MRHLTANGDGTAAAQPSLPIESLVQIRDAARRERLLDMERRARRYRSACFAILALALVATAPEVGWGWLLPLGAGFAGFIVANRFMHASARPALWVAG